MQNAECLALSVTGVLTAAARVGAHTFPDAPKNFCGQVVSLSLSRSLSSINEGTVALQTSYSTTNEKESTCIRLHRKVKV